MALSAGKPIDQYGAGEAVPDEFYLKQKGSTTIYAGGLVMLNASGFALPGAAVASQTAAGVAMETSTNGGADGTVSVLVRRGVYKFKNKSGDLVTQAMVLTNCYFEDDETVRLTSAGSSVAGKVIQVDSDGVWVQVGA